MITPHHQLVRSVGYAQRSAKTYADGMQRSPLPLTAFAVLLLAACSSDPNLPAPHCRAAGASAQLGKQIDDKVISEAIKGSGAARTRTLPWHTPDNTGDVDPLRLNIEVDANGTIQRLRCG